MRDKVLGRDAEWGRAGSSGRQRGIQVPLRTKHWGLESFLYPDPPSDK